MSSTTRQRGVTLTERVTEVSAATSGNAVTSLPAVTVTAQKREETAQEVATSLTVLSGDDLLDKGVGRSASEILNYVPNASAGTQQHGRPRWWIRGVGAGQQQLDLASPIGFYLDEVYISNANATGFPLFDLDRVEVLRGPQGTLWGKNTTGGAISVVSKKPTFAPDGYIKLDYGSYQDRIVEGAIGGTLKEETLAGRFSFHSEEQGDGRFNNRFTGKKDGKLKDDALRAQLLAIISPNFDANVNVHYRDYKTNGAITTVASYAPSGVFRNGYIPSKDPDDVSSNAPNWSDTTQTGGVINLKWQLGRLSLTSISGYEDFDTESLTDSDNTPLEVARGHTKAKSKQWTQEFRLASPKEDKISWVAGLYYFDETVDSDAATARLPNGTVLAVAGSSAPTTYADAIYNHKAKSYAVFGSTRVAFTDDLETTFGLRWSTEKKDLRISRVQYANATPTFGNIGAWWLPGNVTGTINPSVSNNNFTKTLSKTWDAVTFDVTPEYKLSKSARVYAKYAHGVKSGGFNTAATDVRALLEVKPEKLDSYELGYKSEWFNRQLIFNANVFHYDYKNDQVNVVGSIAGAAVSYLQNVADAHVDGSEFELEALPFENFHVVANLGLLKTRFDKFLIVSGPVRDGNEFVRSPHVTAQLGADYRIPLSSGGNVVVGGDYRFISHQFYYVNPQSPAQRGPGTEVSLLEQRPYALVNGRLSFSTAGDKQTVTLYVNNLTDKVYKNHSLPAFIPGVANGDAVYWAQPRTVGASLTARW